MPRLTRAQKDARKAKADALKESEASTTGNNNDNTISTSNSAPCSTSPHLVSNGGETRVLTAGERKQETATKSNASEVVQDKKPEKSGVVIGKERSDGGERGPGESKQENATKINASEVVQDKRPEKSTAEFGKDRSDGGERGPGQNKHQKVNEVNAFTTVQNKRAEKSRDEIAKDRSGGGERGPSRKSGEEETVSLRPSQLEWKQNQREPRSGFAGSKGFRQDFDGRNSSASQNYGGYNSRQGGQHGYNENRWSGRGGSNEGDSRRIDALGRALSGILRHKAPQLGLKVRSDGYVVVKDLLSLHTKTSAGLPLNAHSVDDLKEAVNRDNKQRFGLREEKGQLLIRANQGHSLETINSADLLKQVLSAEEVPVGRGDDDALLERPMSQVCISPLLPSSAGAQSHHEHGEPNGAAATMPTTTIPITLSETPTTLVDPDWQEGDPVGTQGWRDFVSNVITGMVTSMGTQRPVWASHGLQHSAGRHEDIFEPVAQLRAELEAQRGAVEERLHRENFELRVEVARLGGIIEGMKMMRKL